MTWKDKLEIGLKEDAPHRKDNVPAREIPGPELPASPGRSPEITLARVSGAEAPTEPKAGPALKKAHRVVPVRSGPAK
jgi:hypothetical protein